MSAAVQALVRKLMRAGWRRGVVQGNRVWIVVGGLALLGNLAGRAAGREEETVFRERIRPGEAFQVTHLPKD